MSNVAIDYERAWEVEKELQRRQIKRLGLTTHEPYYVLIEDEITQLRAQASELQRQNDELREAVKWNEEQRGIQAKEIGRLTNGTG